MAKKRKPRSERYVRFLDQDGNFNIKRRGMPKAFLNDLYHWLITIRWLKFFGMVVVVYLGINVAFACLYLLGGDCVVGARSGSFADMFFFSVQTLSTIGYGGLSPKTPYANVIVTIEAFMGMVVTALLTGLVFAKFSLPTARVAFSNNAIIREFDGQRSLVFRMANLRTNQIVDATLTVLLAQYEFFENGERFRRLYDLKLSRRRTSMFALSWTAIHIIDEDSPLLDLDVDDWRANEIELVVSLSGVDGTFGHTIQARHSYTLEDMLFDMAFVDMVTPMDDGYIEIDYRPFHQVKPLDKEE